MKTVERFDIARLGRVRKTQQGFIQVPARLTRTGVLEYQRADGSIRRELRLPEEVFSDRSLETLKAAPVTDTHKGGMVTPENVRDLQVGLVRDDVRQDEKFVQSTLLIQDKDAIKAVLSGERKEVSAGYTCAIEHSDGVYNGVPYDVVQRGIRYNHVAIGPADWGRAGNEVSIHLDGDAARSCETLEENSEHEDAGQLGLFIQQQLELLGLSQIRLARDAGIDELKLTAVVQGFDTPSRDELQRMAQRLGVSAEKLDKLIPDADRRDAGDIRMKKITLHLDGADFVVEVPEALADDLAARYAKQVKKLDSETARADEAEAKLSEVEGKLDAAEKELTTVKSPEHIQERIAARVSLEGRARKVLGADEKFDGKSDREIMEAVVAKASKDTRLDGKDDAYVKGVFEFVTDREPEKAPPRNTREDARRAAKTPSSGDEDRKDSREAFLERSREAWKQPLGVSKDTAN